MSRATPVMRNFAKRLIACQATAKKSSESSTLEDFPECARLRPHLATLMGEAGFRALLRRALTLASGEVAWLRRAQISSSDSWEGLEKLHAQIPPAEFSEGKVVLLAHLVGLLVAFIGEDLTVRLIGEVWPQFSPPTTSNLERSSK